MTSDSKCTKPVQPALTCSAIKADFAAKAGRQADSHTCRPPTAKHPSTGTHEAGATGDVAQAVPVAEPMVQAILCKATVLESRDLAIHTRRAGRVADGSSATSWSSSDGHE